MSATIKVQHKHAPMAHHKAGLSYTRSGYGSKIPNPTMVLYMGRWRRVYTTIWSNSGTSWIVVNRRRHIVDRLHDGFEVRAAPWGAEVPDSHNR